MDHRTSLVLVCGFCQVFGVRIIGCIDDKIEIFEDSPSPVTCEDIRGDAVWRQEGSLVGVCSPDGTCSNNVPNDYIVSRSPMSTESQLTLVPGYRRHAGVAVTCQERAVYSHTCTIVIIPSVRLPVTDSSSSEKPETGSMSVATLTGAIIGSIAIVAVIVAVIVLLIVRRRRRLHRTSSEGSLPSGDTTTGPSHRGLPTIPPAIPPAIPPFYLDNKQTDTSSHPTGSVYEEQIPLANHSPGLTETSVPPNQEDDVYIELDIADSATT